MKIIPLAAALALGVAGAAASAAPPRVVLLPTEQVGSMDPSQESPAAARHEARAALAEAKVSCRQESGRQEQRDCLSDARNDHDRLMAQAAEGRNDRDMQR